MNNIIKLYSTRPKKSRAYLAWAVNKMISKGKDAFRTNIQNYSRVNEFTKMKYNEANSKSLVKVMLHSLMWLAVPRQQILYL